MIVNPLLFEIIVASCLLSGLLFLTFALISSSRSDLFIKTLTIGFSSLIAFNLLFFSLMMIDRSKSLYLVRWVGECAPIKKEKLLSAISETLEQQDYEYLNRRIEEQKLRGIIKSNSVSELELSTTGKMLFQVSNGIAKVYGLNEWKKISISESKNCTNS
jgi:hypothetical protein